MADQLLFEQEPPKKDKGQPTEEMLWHQGRKTMATAKTPWQCRPSMATYQWYIVDAEGNVLGIISHKTVAEWIINTRNGVRQ